MMLLFYDELLYLAYSKLPEILNSYLKRLFLCKGQYLPYEKAKAKIETSTYCNDTTVDTSVTSSTQYMPNTRASVNTPSVVCPTGANVISSKVGFLTVDEVTLAGRTGSNGMHDYLDNNDWWWLGSPFNFFYGDTSGFRVDCGYGVYSASSINYRIGLRLVVSILSNTAITGGDGSQLTPWIIG